MPLLKNIFAFTRAARARLLAAAAWRLTAAALLLSTLPHSAPQAQADKPDKDALAAALIERSNIAIEQLAALKAQGKLNAAAALRLIRRHTSPLLDFSQLTRGAMGKYWRRASEQERADVTAAFRVLLENTYAKVLTRFNDQQVKLLSAQTRPRDKIAILLQVSGEGKSVQIEYVYGKSSNADSTDEEYLVHDIKVEKISLISNYRRQFAAVLSKQKNIAALIERLHEMAAKNAAANTQ